MNDKKILIWIDESAKRNFETNVLEVQQRCNELIDLFETFQEWQKVTSYKNWIDLITDPGGYFDKVLLSSVNLSISGNKSPDPGELAKLVSVDRENYLNAVAGKPVKDDCIPCQKTRIRKGKIVISYETYKQYQDFLIFDTGNFYPNQEAIDRKAESFKIWAETDSQISIYELWQNLCKVLNEYDEMYNIPLSGKEQIVKALKLQLSEGSQGKFIVNNISLSQLIKNAKS
jgi:hypothetical protein